jgi:hypothetical protein
MTTFATQQVECAVCGTGSEQQVVGSTIAMGSPDLDFRPAELQRSTIKWLLQECLNCGYVSPDLSKEEPGAREIMDDEAFVVLQSGSAGGTLAQRYLKRSLLDEKLGHLKRAAERTLAAAWAADDASNPDASQHRTKAIDLFAAAAMDMPDGSKESIMQRVRMIDLQRRAGNFGKAVTLADSLLAEELDPTARSVAEFGRGKAVSKDANVYRVADAIPQAVPPPVHLEQRLGKTAVVTHANKCWAVTFAIWFAGVGVLWLIWNTRVFASEVAETIFGLILFLVGFLYFLALRPIRTWVGRNIFRNDEDG